ncbi:histone acetyltransferase [Hamiltosporidium tvaerminnensis]|uniref:Histone acetyltransferase n=1 Tax=Hamiltosporidium tvaerminnensis TaxID=1176355 RepID=A0A4Q9LWI0_9MICR|nr:histone acetyltransferase [Hamiltosporidium tvaerminnensis]
MDIEIGYKLPVKKDMKNGEIYQKAEILGIRKTRTGKEYYVHYTDFNKRLDEWVDESCLKIDNIEEIEIPKKKKKSVIERKVITKRKSIVTNKSLIQEITPNKVYEDERTTVALKKTPFRKEMSPNLKDLEINEEILDKNQSLATDESNKVKNVRKIRIGNYTVDAWYFSPYPEKIATSEIIYICQYCLFYFATQKQYEIHTKKCDLKHPPGNEIYRNQDISFFEIDGYSHKNYCRNLCLLSKLFLDHKTLYFDVDPFMFYILCRYENGYKIVGYFSKEKDSLQGYNLACLLTLPHEQKKGYGKVLIDFSYLLSKKENAIASPEKPLSDLGLLSYRSYWSEVIIEIIQNKKKTSISEISKLTSITEDDILSTLVAYGIIKFYHGYPIFIIKGEIFEKMIKGKKTRVNEHFLKWEGPVKERLKM